MSGFEETPISKGPIIFCKSQHTILKILSPAQQGKAKTSG